MGILRGESLDRCMKVWMFFFSSRRRHTRLRRDWSSDVCSSDLLIHTFGKYSGELKNGLLHGQGTYTYVNGSKYVGEFKDGKKSGQGTYTFVNGSKYVGEFKEIRRASCRERV